MYNRFMILGLLRTALLATVLAQAISIDLAISFLDQFISAAQAQSEPATEPLPTTPAAASDNARVLPATTPQPPISKIRKAPAAAETYQRRGVVVAAKQIRLTSRVDGVVSAIQVKAGQPFEKNDLLIEFDCSIERAALEEARLLHEMAKFDYNVKLRLVKDNATSTEEFELSQLKMEVALAKLNHLRERVATCKLFAPFAGWVLKVDVQQHQSVVHLQPVIEIIEKGPLYFRLFLPWAWQQWVSVGDRVAVVIAGQSFQAELSDFSPEVDAINQSVKALLRLPPEADLPIGASGIARFKAPQPN